MRTEKWNLTSAAKYGAVASPLLMLAQVLIGNARLSGPASYMVGELIGMVLGGVLLFVVVAYTRNLFVR